MIMIMMKMSAWLAQLVGYQTVVREVEGSSPGQTNRRREESAFFAMTCSLGKRTINRKSLRLLCHGLVRDVKEPHITVRKV